ncbi:MAG: hypothetical protein AAF098_11610 [Pseudomonadota bacterium]
MKNTPSKQHCASDMLADYLNEHLTESDREYVESALASDESLQEQLQFEENLKKALLAESELVEAKVATSNAGFAGITDRIDPPQSSLGNMLSDFLDHWRWLAIAAPVAVLLLMVSTGVRQPASVSPIQEFETAFDDKADYQAPTLLVLFEEPLEAASLSEFLAVYDLRLIEEAAVGPMLELRSQNQEANLRAVATKIGDHPRVLAVKLLGVQP